MAAVRVHELAPRDPSGLACKGRSEKGGGRSRLGFSFAAFFCFSAVSRACSRAQGAQLGAAGASSPGSRK
eukprot:2762188-Pyramimonas_sp.AAC.1